MNKSMMKACLIRAAPGALFGLCLQVLIASLAASLFSPTLEFSMMVFSAQHPLSYRISELLSTLLMLLIGAEIGLSTLPFSEYGKSLRWETAGHFVAMMLTVSALGWVLDGKWGVLEWLLPSALLYALIWLGRWMGWYAELAQIKERLGIASKPSILKWRETLPHAAFAFLLCAVIPVAAAVLDSDHILWLLYMLSFIPTAGFAAGMSLGRRQGICLLYSLACGIFSMVSIPLTMADTWWMCPLFALVPALLGNLLGAAIRAGETLFSADNEKNR